MKSVNGETIISHTAVLIQPLCWLTKTNDCFTFTSAVCIKGVGFILKSNHLLRTKQTCIYPFTHKFAVCNATTTTVGS
jgi:hypothetical protein